MTNPPEKLKERIRKILWSLVDDPITKRADYIESPTKTIWNIGDQILQAYEEAITNAEFNALDCLGIEQFTEEQVLCFISMLREIRV